MSAWGADHRGRLGASGAASGVWPRPVARHGPGTQGAAPGSLPGGRCAPGRRHHRQHRLRPQGRGHQRRDRPGAPTDTGTKAPGAFRWGEAPRTQAVRNRTARGPCAHCVTPRSDLQLHHHLPGCRPALPAAPPARRGCRLAAHLPLPHPSRPHAPPSPQFGFAAGGSIHLQVFLYDANGTVVNSQPGRLSTGVYLLTCGVRALSTAGPLRTG